MNEEAEWLLTQELHWRSVLEASERSRDNAINQLRRIAVLSAIGLNEEETDFVTRIRNDLRDEQRLMACPSVMGLSPDLKEG